jgi:hypothetical protein
MFFKKWLCKRKGHDFEYTHVEPDGWGNHWYWKKCNRCNFSTFDITDKKVKHGTLRLVGKQG